MHIKIIEGDLLEAPERIICHQVNCQGVMGSGLAKQIKEKWPELYRSYKRLCDSNTNKKELLGQVMGVHVNGHTQIVYNLFGQNTYGYKQLLYTSYDALRKCFQAIAKKHKGETIAMPYMIGCNRGGGDWKIVFRMIKDTFEDCYVVLYRMEE
jgi:O-acetyl-ADP-ribose deacetylase (regulator of RNase III)